MSSQESPSLEILVVLEILILDSPESMGKKGEAEHSAEIWESLDRHPYSERPSCNDNF